MEATTPPSVKAKGQAKVKRERRGGGGAKQEEEEARSGPQLGGVRLPVVRLAAALLAAWPAPLLGARAVMQLPMGLPDVVLRDAAVLPVAA